MQRHLIAGILLAALPLTLAAQQQSASPSRPIPYATNATAVLVDAVVRDKSGHPVMDVKPGEFEIYEDGIRQEIASFSIVSRGVGIGVDVRLRAPDAGNTTVVAPTGPAGVDAAATEAPSIVALVFDALSAEALRFCQNAALQQISLASATPSQIGVFATEPTVRILQRYTDNPALIRNAVRQIGATGTEARDARQERLLSLRQRRDQMDASGMTVANAVSAAGTGSQGNSGIGAIEIERRTIESELRMLQAFDSLDRDHRGYGTSNSLMAVLASMAYMPGRKSVIFFSEGLPASPGLQSSLQSLIENANRSNITIYAVDAKGLRVLSSTEQTRKEVNAAGADRLRQSPMPDSLISEPLMRALERNEDLLRLDSQGGLARLAEDTGGFLVRDTNDIASAFRRIDEDIRFHYLLTYSPQNDVLDGKFRTITVKVKRPNTMVYARKGYRAIRSPGTSPVFTYEAPALMMLDSNPLPNAFPSRAGAFVFPEKDRPGLTPIVVRVRTDALRFQVDGRRSTYSAQAAVVVRVRDGSGQLIQKFSQQYVLSGDAKDAEAAKAGEILFYREAELPPGAYQMESLVYDANAETGSGRVSSIEIPPREGPRLKMSSVMLIDHSEKTPGRTTQGDKEAPFYYGDTLFYPNLGETISRGRQDELPFYFVVYQVPGRCACTAHIALLRNGQPLADATRPLTPENETRLQHVGKLPIANLPSGTYELRVTVSDGQEQQSRSAFFTVA